MNISDKDLTTALQKGGYVDEKDWKRGSEFAASHEVTLAEAFLSQNILTTDLLGQAMAEFYKTSYADLDYNQPNREEVLKVSRADAIKYRTIFFQAKGKQVMFATDDPSQKNLKKVFGKYYQGKKLSFLYGLPAEIDKVLLLYQPKLSEQVKSIQKKGDDVAAKLVEVILAEAFAHNASDIHCEPRDEKVIVRFRIDGVMQERAHLTMGYYRNVLNRMKLKSGLRIDEHFAAQDGSLRYEYKDKKYDLRISIIPTLNGEKLVLRVLSGYVTSLSFEDLGLSEHHQQMLLAAAKKPYGMILVTGPTGSGKSTTLYALVHLLNRPEVNITTIEDPIEYRLPGVNQIQVNTQKKLTFSKGLRAIVRQDPDVILVGEIRDAETAEIAVNAGLTGHLLFSTFHSNDAATAVPRLMEMGMEPFLVASTLELLIAQRLVRKICEHCRTSVNLTPAQLKKKHPGLGKFFSRGKQRLYKGKGCESCGGTGYHGQTAIFEFLPVDSQMQDLIAAKPSAQAINELARKGGFVTMFESGLEKVRAGVTTIDELLRVANPPQK